MPSPGSRSVEQPPLDEETSSPTPAGKFPASDYDEWEMEERLRHLDRIYARSPLRSPLTTAGAHHFRIDSQHAALPHEPRMATPPTGANSSWVARLGLLTLAFGLAITVCGGCLMGWSHSGTRPELMPVGIPIAVVGQVFLLIGLVLQMDSSDAGTKRSADRRDDRKRSLSIGRWESHGGHPSDKAQPLRNVPIEIDRILKELEGESQ